MPHRRRSIDAPIAIQAAASLCVCTNGSHSPCSQTPFRDIMGTPQSPSCHKAAFVSSPDNGPNSIQPPFKQRSNANGTQSKNKVVTARTALPPLVHPLVTLHSLSIVPQALVKAKPVPASCDGTHSIPIAAIVGHATDAIPTPSASLTLPRTRLRLVPSLTSGDEGVYLASISRGLWCKSVHKYNR